MAERKMAEPLFRKEFINRLTISFSLVLLSDQKRKDLKKSRIVIPDKIGMKNSGWAVDGCSVVELKVKVVIFEI